MTGHLLELVAFSPNQAAAPTLTRVGPLPFGSLTLVDEVSRPGSLDCGVNLDRLPADSHQHLRDPFANPCELTLDRQGTDGVWRRVFTGPVVSPAIRQGATVQIQAKGLLAYLAYMGVDTFTGGYDFTDVDQHQIVKSLVDGWQALDYADMGIDTSTITDGGKLRTVAYPTSEIHVVLDRAIQLGERQGGFDLAVDPDSRELQLWTPERGTDKSSAVHFDARNTASGDEHRSVAPGESATSVHAVSSGGHPDDDVLTSTQVDATAMASFGRRFHGTSERNVIVQATLDDKASQALSDRASMRYQLGPDLRLAVGADWGDFQAGDTVNSRFDAGLGEVQLAPRVIKRTLKVDASGEETMRLGFG